MEFQLFSVLLAVLLSSGTLRVTVEQYETLRGILIWK
jgi:hypothetical protein